MLESFLEFDITSKEQNAATGTFTQLQMHLRLFLVALFPKSMCLLFIMCKLRVSLLAANRHK